MHKFSRLYFFGLSFIFLSASPAQAAELPLSFTEASIAKNMALGQTQVLEFTIKNNLTKQSLPLKNIGIINDGDSQSASVTSLENGDCGSSLPPQASCSFNVNISNVSIGSLTRHVNIDYNGRAPLKSPIDINIQQAEYTVLIYMVGSNLESSYGFATKNIAQMEEVGSTANMNVVLETGGATKPGWLSVERKLVLPNGIYQISDLGPSVNMADTATISSFLEWGINNFPANKYIAIFWDHGSGPNGGFGSDQNFGNAETPINQLSSAAQTAVAAVDHNFEIIGFDTCLLGNLETASGLYPYSNYYVASEDLEPGTGWQYNTFLEYINENPTANGLEIGTEIVNGFTEQNLGEPTTLSVVDSSQIPNLLTAIGNFSTALITHTSSTADWKNVSQARYQSRDYNTSPFKTYGTDVVDLQNFTTNVSAKFPGDATLQQASTNLLTAIGNAVKYSQNSENRQNSYGVTVYFPSVLNQYATGYPNVTTLNGNLFYSQSYINLVSSFMNYYDANTMGLMALPSNLNYDGANYTAVVSNAYNYLYAAVGNDNCTLPMKKSGKKTLQVLPCYTSLQYQNIQATPGSGTTWNISFNKAANASSWPLVNGVPVLLIPDDTTPVDPNETVYYVPVVNASGINGFLYVEYENGEYSVEGFIEDTSTQGKIGDINDGDQFTVRTYALSGGVWSLMPTSTTVTAPLTISLGAVPGSSFNAFRYIVEDLTGSLNITSTSQSY